MSDHSLPDETLADVQAAGGEMWQRHSCRPSEPYPHVELRGQTLTRIVDGGLYYFDHRREYAKTRNITPRTYYITEGPTGLLSESQSLLSDTETGYTRYTIDVVFDVENCLGPICAPFDEDVEASCVFNSD